MKLDIDKAKYDAIQAQKQAQNANYKADELQSHALVLKDMLIRGKEEGRAIHAQNSALTEQTRNVKKENADRELAAKMAAAQAQADADAAAAKAAAEARRAEKAANASRLASQASDASSLGSEAMVRMPTPMVKAARKERKAVKAVQTRKHLLEHERPT